MIYRFLFFPILRCMGFFPLFSPMPFDMYSVCVFVHTCFNEKHVVIREYRHQRKIFHEFILHLMKDGFSTDDMIDTCLHLAIQMLIYYLQSSNQAVNYQDDLSFLNTSSINIQIALDRLCKRLILHLQLQFAHYNKKVLI